MKNEVQLKALLYARVSDKSQKINGSGLESQAHRCFEHAKNKGYSIVETFQDDFTGAGDFMRRPGMVRLLKYLEDHPYDNFVVVFDDLKRFARDTEFHLKLRKTLRAYGAEVECLNYRFDDTPEGEFVETVFAAQGQLERQQNQRQTKQKIAACLERGYWPFKVPVGYKRIKVKGQGKPLVKDEPRASIVREVYEGVASGRFPSQMDVKRFLEQFPEFPNSNGYVHLQRVKELLSRPLYAGYIDAPEWGVRLLKGLHEPLISFSTYQKVQEKIHEQTKVYSRRIEQPDFPIRGCVFCGHCGFSLTAYWAAGRNKKYAYYECKNRQCSEAYAQSIKKDLIEGEFEKLLRQIAPKKEVFSVAKMMLEKNWQHYKELHVVRMKSLKAQVGQYDRRIDAIATRIVDTEAPAVIRALEKQLQDAEVQKIICQEKIENSKPPQGSFEETFRTAIALLQNPYKWFTTKAFLDRRIALKLIFDGKLEWVQGLGFRTPPFSSPVNSFNGLSSLIDTCGTSFKNGGPTRT